MKICKKCKHHSRHINTGSSFSGNDITEQIGFICSENGCECSISGNARKEMDDQE